jgi:hypothetical protein
VLPFEICRVPADPDGMPSVEIPAGSNFIATSEYPVIARATNTHRGIPSAGICARSLDYDRRPGNQCEGEKHLLHQSSKLEPLQISDPEAAAQMLMEIANAVEPSRTAHRYRVAQQTFGCTRAAMREAAAHQKTARRRSLYYCPLLDFDFVFALGWL